MRNVYAETSCPNDKGSHEMLSHLLRRAPQGVLARGLKTLSPSPPASKRVVPLTAQTYPSMTRSPSYARLQPAHLEYFASVLGADRVLTDSELVETYNTDWTRKYKGQSSCVLRPSTTEEVASILAYCHREGIAVVPQAGNTGVVGGSVPVFDEVILSVSLMNQVKAFDDVSGIITCQAGCILENLDKYCSDRGFMMPLGEVACGDLSVDSLVSQ